MTQEDGMGRDVCGRDCFIDVSNVCVKGPDINNTEQ